MHTPISGPSHTPGGTGGSFRGFSFIELLAVLAVLAVLAMLAAPSMIDRIIRNQITEALPLADIAKAPVAAAWAASAALPADNTAADLPAAEKIVSTYVRAVAIENGAIHLTFGNSANSLIRDKVLTLRPTVVEDAPIVPVSWVCAQGKVPDKMTAKGQDRTTVPAAYLPLKCRS